MSTQTIPTDRNGRIYYGPTTLKGAQELVHQLRDELDEDNAGAKVAAQMEEAGYPGIAARIRSQFC